MFHKYINDNSGVYEISYRMEIGAREEQQDSGLLIVENGQVFAAVCDGMGGLQHGKLASATAIDTIMQLYTQRDSLTEPKDFFYQAVDIMDEAVCNIRRKLGNSCLVGTTCVAVWIGGCHLSWLSVGDSRLYLIRDTEMVCATVDHNYESYLAQEGVPLQGASSATHRKDALMSFVGMGGIEWMDVNSSPLSLQEGDLILLMTDGLYKSVVEEQILSVIHSHENLDSAMEELIQLARRQGGNRQDNTTVIAVKYRGNKNEIDQV